jgi:hypothetical protein
VGVELEAISRRERVSLGDERETAAEILSGAKDLLFHWRKRVGVEPTIAAERRRSQVLKTGPVTGLDALPLCFQQTDVVTKDL